MNISGYKISLKNYNIYNHYTNKVSVTFYTDYAADDGMMEIYTSTYLVDKNYKETYGSVKRIDVEYPMEYQSDRDDSRIQTSIE